MLQPGDKHGRKYLTADERRRFIAATALARKPADQAFVLMIAHTGARVSGVLVSRALDVDLGAGAISYRPRAQALPHPEG